MANSNRYFGMTPIRVTAAENFGSKTPYVVCPVCNSDVPVPKDEIGYHGNNGVGGSHLCDGSGLIVGEIVTPLEIVFESEVKC